MHCCNVSYDFHNIVRGYSSTNTYKIRGCSGHDTSEKKPCNTYRVVHSVTEVTTELEEYPHSIAKWCWIHITDTVDQQHACRIRYKKQYRKRSEEGSQSDKTNNSNLRARNSSQALLQCVRRTPQISCENTAVERLTKYEDAAAIIRA